MSLKQQFELMADYNRWFNEKVYLSVATLDRPALQVDRGAFFGSIFGTLNHILVADIIWLTRFATHPAGFASLDRFLSEAPPASLSQPLHDDFAAMSHARRELDGVITAFSREASEGDYARPFAYRNMKGQAFVKQFGLVMLHFYNHQTHHRGQTTVLLHQAGIDVGVTDLLPIIPDMNADQNGDAS